MLRSPTETLPSISTTYRIFPQYNTEALHRLPDFGGKTSEENNQADAFCQQSKTERFPFRVEFQLDKKTFEIAKKAFTVEAGIVQYRQIGGSWIATKATYLPDTSQNFSFYSTKLTEEADITKLYLRIQQWNTDDRNAPYSTWTMIDLGIEKEALPSLDGVLLDIKTPNPKNLLDQKISVIPNYIPVEK